MPDIFKCSKAHYLSISFPCNRAKSYRDLILADKEKLISRTEDHKKVSTSHEDLTSDGSLVNGIKSKQTVDVLGISKRCSSKAENNRGQSH